MNILIVEDEPLAQKEMRRLLAGIAPDSTIMAALDSIESTVDFLKSHKPDLIFMDIQLADGQSFEIFTHVKVEAPVIFTTAYDSYAMQAFQANGIDYLLKPVEPEGIRKALEKFKRWNKPEESQNLDSDKLISWLKAQKQTFKSRFMVTVGDRIRFVNDTEITYFQADDEVVYLFTNEKKKYIINHSLESLESQLDPSRFFRINRRYLCSIDSIGEIFKHLNSRLKIHLIPETSEEVFVSRARVQDFLAWLGQ
ncbi:MAG TPA: LytTR family DNA-binding domain-containing protein [Catalimonadaceae bacterium]|nr:LytTR family DNA-binding domain-containing protein [Catalimonadaceae bacterium]